METLFVVTANRFFRESLIRLFRGDKGFRVTGASDCSPLLALSAPRVNPGIVLLRPEWDDQSFQCTRAIHDARPASKILMIGMEDNQDIFLRAVRAGALGYVLKDASAKQMLAAAHRLEQNGVVCPPHLERALFNLIASGSSFSPRPPSIADLTPRAHQLTSLLAQGLANKEIAVRLNLSLQTVKNHVHSILQKTQSKNRAMFAQLVGLSVPMDGTHEKLESHLPLSSST